MLEMYYGKRLSEVSTYEYACVSTGRSSFAVKEIRIIIVCASGNYLFIRYRLGDYFAYYNTDDADEGVGFFCCSGTCYGVCIALSYCGYRP